MTEPSMLGLLCFLSFFLRRTSNWQKMPITVGRARKPHKLNIVPTTALKACSSSHTDSAQLCARGAA
jgi:hypothetical protein